MDITAAQVKEIRKEFTKLKPAKVTLNSNRKVTVKEAIRTLTPTLERMIKRGFDTQDIVEMLHERGIEVKQPTLKKYLNEFNREKEQKKDTPRLPKKTASALQPDRPATVGSGEFVITPDIPLNEL